MEYEALFAIKLEAESKQELYNKVERIIQQKTFSKYYNCKNY